MSDTQSKGQYLNELRRGRGAGTHGKHGKARNRDERRKENQKIRKGDWS
jgi:hypothetical protein